MYSHPSDAMRSSDQSVYLLLNMASGRTLRATHLMLYPELAYQRAIRLRAQAQEEMGGYSTGLGFIGSPSWVIAGSLALGFIESVIANAKFKKGIDLLKQAVAEYEKLKSAGEFFPISAISAIERPCPADWRAAHISELEIDLNHLGVLDRAALTQQYEITRKQLTTGVATVKGSMSYVHNEDEFIWVFVDGESTAVRWSFVEGFRVTDSPTGGLESAGP